MSEATAPPYVIVPRLNPGLARVTDTRDGESQLWSRTLTRGRGFGRGTTSCANCSGTLLGGYYKPPSRKPAIRERLCRACVEDPPPAADGGAT